MVTCDHVPGPLKTKIKKRAWGYEAAMVLYRRIKTSVESHCGLVEDCHVEGSKFKPCWSIFTYLQPHVYRQYKRTAMTVISISTLCSFFQPAPGDYQELVDATLTIAAGSAINTEVCGSVMVIGDLIREPNEVFTVHLTPQNSNDDISTVVEFRVTIRDDNDSEFSSSQQSPG